MVHPFLLLTTMTTELSPAALTVWSAFLDHYEWEVTQTELCAVAAALHEAADHLPDPQMSAHFLHAIADELEAQ